jgi:hypothetical protein
VGGVSITINKRNGKRYESRHYSCLGKRKDCSPVTRCLSKKWVADKLEALVWAELERYLSDHDLIVSEIEKQRQDAGQVGVFEAELESIERQLTATDREQHQLLQWALKGFPESQVEAENRRLNQAKETLKAQKTELETQLKASRDAAINIPNLKRFIEDVQDRLKEVDYEGKRLALKMLGITVYLHAENVEVTGTIDPGIVLTPLSMREHNTTIPFSLKTSAKT